jgi:hypothetical protein
MVALWLTITQTHGELFRRGTNIGREKRNADKSQLKHVVELARISHQGINADIESIKATQGIDGLDGAQPSAGISLLSIGPQRSDLGARRRVARYQAQFSVLGDWKHRSCKT